MASLPQAPYTTTAQSQSSYQEPSQPHPQYKEDQPTLLEKYIYYPIQAVIRIPKIVFKAVWLFFWRYYK